jgi:hypothetical protein
MTEKSDRFKQAYSKLQTTKNNAAQITAWMEDRYYWGDTLEELRSALIRSEDDIKKKLSAQKPGVEAGIWIEQLSTDSSLAAASGGTTYAPPMGAPGGGHAGRMPAAVAPAADASGTAEAAPGSVISLVCRAVDLTSVDPSANSEIAYAVENQLKSSTNYFKPEGTALTGQITPDVNGTFTFGVTVTLLNPLKL